MRIQAGLRFCRAEISELKAAQRQGISTGQDLEPTACEIKVDGSNQNVNAYSTNSGRGGAWVTLWGKR